MHSLGVMVVVNLYDTRTALCLASAFKNSSEQFFLYSEIQVGIVGNHG